MFVVSYHTSTISLFGSEFDVLQCSTWKQNLIAIGHSGPYQQHEKWWGRGKVFESSQIKWCMPVSLHQVEAGSRGKANLNHKNKFKVMPFLSFAVSWLRAGALRMPGNILLRSHTLCPEIIFSGIKHYTHTCTYIYFKYTFCTVTSQNV